MKNILVISFLIVLFYAKSQNDIDSLKIVMFNILNSVDSTKKRDNNLFYISEGKIKYKNNKYSVIIFTSKPSRGLLYLYILFYKNSTNYILLGKNGIVDDLLELNRIYLNSNLKKRLYASLYTYIIEDYFPNGRGRVVPRAFLDPKK